MKLLVLAAGYSVRLQPLTLNMPKPLLTIGNKTMMDRILAKVTKSPIRFDSVYIITNAKFFEKFEEWVKSSIYKDIISLINDGTMSNETRLGAIKDMNLAITDRSIDDDLVVIAGDNLFDFDFVKFMDFAKRHPDGISVALYDINDIESAKKYGVVEIDKNGLVINFEEKPLKPKSTLVSTGIYYFPKNKLSFIKKYVKMQSKLDAPGYYISWLSKRDKVYGYTFIEDWYDIGSIESYKKADREYLEKEKRKNGKA